MAELLLELFGEEIPARMQARAIEDFERALHERLKSAGLEFDGGRRFVTPRRMTLVVEGLPLKQPDTTEERRGPRVDVPDKAIAGFLKSTGLPRDALEKRELDKGTFYFAVVHTEGQRTEDVLAELIPEAIAAVPWAKSMKWSDHGLRWVRPLHRILCLFDGRTIAFPFGHLTAGDETSGHRFLAPSSFRVADASDYVKRLGEAFVMLDAGDRRALIETDARTAAEKEGLMVRPDAALAAENAGLVEWPLVHMGHIDTEFMDLPPEVLTTAMGRHQKYFAVQKSDGALAPRFVMVANMVTADGGAEIVAGNERVLRARLADAQFFWRQDRERPLESRIGDLRNMVFHAKLGTLAEKVERMAKLAAEIGGWAGGAEPDVAACAARLSKADLTSGMVGEFPELQGVMGRYYARHDGEDAAITDAIADHYAPQGPNDRCPNAPISICVALADKIDTLVGFFGIGEKPTGSKDPFALRRAALGVIRLILENRLRISLLPMFRVAGTLFGKDDQETGDALLAFIADRLKIHLRGQGVRHDLVSAVFSSLADDDLVRLMSKVTALQKFLAGEDGANLLTAYRRASKIVDIEERRDGTAYAPEIDAGILEAVEEITLYDKLDSTNDRITQALRAERFDEAMATTASLRPSVDDFFDRVTVNCETPEVRQNRLRLLARIRARLNSLADFSKIEG